MGLATGPSGKEEVTRMGANSGWLEELKLGGQACLVPSPARHADSGLDFSFGEEARH